MNICHQDSNICLCFAMHSLSVSSCGRGRINPKIAYSQILSGLGPFHTPQGSCSQKISFLFVTHYRCTLSSSPHSICGHTSLRRIDWLPPSRYSTDPPPSCCPCSRDYISVLFGERSPSPGCRNRPFFQFNKISQAASCKQYLIQGSCH